MTDKKSRWSEEDMPILKTIPKVMPKELIKNIEISRNAGNIILVLHTNDAEVLFGEKGQNVQNLYKALKEVTGQHVAINVLDLAE